jgi:DNA-binding NtrC family response regulator
VQGAEPHTPVIVLTAYGPETAVEAMKKGLRLPHETVRHRRDGAADRGALALQRCLESAYLREVVRPAKVSTLIGVSDAMQPVFDLIRQVAPAKMSILITGPGREGVRGPRHPSPESRGRSSFRESRRGAA